VKALIISDLDFQTDIFKQLNSLITGHLHEKGFSIERIKIGRNDLAFCRGCFNCWVRKPGECIIDDKMTEINRSYINADAVFFLTPVVFGQFSANMKNARDRWLPNMLPFFKIRPDGSTIHPPRYTEYPNLLIIGYADDIVEEDIQLFIDITKDHLRETGVYFFKGENEKADLINTLDRTELAKVRGIL
jgi:hypothetical protein